MSSGEISTPLILENESTQKIPKSRIQKVELYKHIHSRNCKAPIELECVHLGNFFEDNRDESDKTKNSLLKFQIQKHHTLTRLVINGNVTRSKSSGPQCANLPEVQIQTEFSFGR